MRRYVLAVILLFSLVLQLNAADQFRCLTSPEHSRISAALHIDHLKRLRARRATLTAPPHKDYGNIHVIQATRTGGIYFEPRVFDLAGKSLLFKYNPDTTYDVTFAKPQFIKSTGQPLALNKEKAIVNLNFPFPFHGKSYTTLHVYLGGNIALGQPLSEPLGTFYGTFAPIDKAAQIAALNGFFVDGSVALDRRTDSVVLTWRGLKQGQFSKPKTFQAILFKSGNIQLNYLKDTRASNCLVGIIPPVDKRESVNVVDYTRDVPIKNVTGLLFEAFLSQRQMDYYAIAQNFLATHEDTYDEVVIWTSHPKVSIIPPRTAVAFNSTLKEEVSGIGKRKYDLTPALFGRSTYLTNIVVMDLLEKYPDDPLQAFENSTTETTVTIVAHEVGHKWLSHPRFLDNGTKSTRLLDLAGHWSFFFDSDASIMQGNDLQDNGNGTFTTIGSYKRFSPLDLYLLGLLPSRSVPPMFYVETPGGSSGESNTLPKDGVTFYGTRRDVTMDQIVQAEGPRKPDLNNSPRTVSTPFIFVVEEGRTPTAAQLTKLEAIRVTFNSYFSDLSEDRMLANTLLKGGTIRGIVRAASGKPLGNVSLRIDDSRYGMVRNIRSNSAGIYELQVLPPGNYKVTARLGTKETSKKFSIQSTETVTLDLVL